MIQCGDTLMTIAEYLSSQRALITPSLKNLILKQPQPTVVFEFDVTKFLLDFLMAGKFYRGSLVFLGYDLFAPKKSFALAKNHPDVNALLQTALTVELTHSAFLIHDDVMDQDKLRRGKKSLYCLVQDYAQQQHIVQAQHFGISVAMCLGDLLLFWASEQLALAGRYTDNIAQLTQFYCQEMSLTVWGQIEDVYLANLDLDTSLDSILNVYTLKTAHYTLINPLLLGAMIASVDHNQLEDLKKLALSLGIIFQIKDDELNLLGQAEKIGKPAGSDIKENKKTIYRQLLLDSASPTDKIYLLKLFNGRTQLTEKQFQQFKQLLSKYKIQEKVEKFCQQYEAQLQLSMNQLKLDREAQNLLTEFIQLMLKRSH